MTDEERQLIQSLADRIRNAPAPQIDRDADNLIRQTIGSRADALYILTQTVLIQEMALSQAKQQMEQLKNQAAQPPANFLPNQAPQPPASAGRANEGRAWGGGYQGSSYQGGGNQTYQPPQPPPLPAQYQQTQYVQDPQPSGRFSGFLHNAAQTAAGVVAGEVAFSALSSIFGHHGGGGGFFGGGGGGYYGSPISPGSETIINNYYDEDRGRGGSGGDRDLESSGLSPDLEDRRFAGSGSGDNSGDDTSNDADNNADNDADNDADNNADNDDAQDDSSGSDDGSDSFDDGSSYDDGSGSNDV